MIKINTAASGQFKVYIPDAYGDLHLVSESKNLIVNSGLDAVGTTTWANCLKLAVAGTGSNPVTPTDTFSSMTMVLSSAVASPASPACYTLVDTPASWTDLNGGAVYRIGKTFTLTNTSGSDRTITELGISTSTTSLNLFSRSLVTPFILPNNRFAYIVYELRLNTKASSARAPFSATTDGTTGFTFPADATIGIFSNPFAYLNSVGTVISNTFTNGQAFFEPSCPTYYLYYLRNNPGTNYFSAKRTFYELNQTNLLGSTNTGGTGSGINPAYSSAHTSGNTFSNDDGGTYVSGSFKRTRHIIVAPETPSVSETIYGFAISPVSTPTNIAQTSLHCSFPTTPWTRPTNVFSKFYFEQTWSAA